MFLLFTHNMTHYANVRQIHTTGTRSGVCRSRQYLMLYIVDSTSF